MGLSHGRRSGIRITCAQCFGRLSPCRVWGFRVDFADTSNDVLETSPAHLYGIRVFFSSPSRLYGWWRNALTRSLTIRSVGSEFRSRRTNPFGASETSSMEGAP